MSWCLSFRMRVVVLSPFLVLLCCLPLDADSGRVQPGESVKKILEAREDSTEAATPLEPSELALRLCAVLVLLSLMGCALLKLRRRWGQRRTAPMDASLRIVARLALTPKHFVCVVEAGEQQLVIGVSGDRIVALGTASEPQSSAIGPSSTVVGDGREQHERVACSPAPTATAPAGGLAIARPPWLGAEEQLSERLRHGRRDAPPPASDKTPGSTPTGDPLPHGDDGGVEPVAADRPIDKSQVPLFSAPQGDEGSTLKSDELAPYRDRIDQIKNLLDGGPHRFRDVSK